VEGVTPAPSSKHKYNLFSVIGEVIAGRATALIIAATEADAEYFSVHELGFVTVSATFLMSDSGYVV